MLAAPLDLTTTANTPVSATLSATAANTKLAAGDQLGLDFSGTQTGLTGGVVTIVLQPL